MQRIQPLLVLAGILLLALLLRLVGINWDDYSRLHPDERFLNSLVAKIGNANNLTAEARQRCPDADAYYDYFNTSCSVLNPNNVEDGSYAYGTLPLFIVRGAAQYAAQVNFLNLDNPDYWLTYDYIHLIGRGMNALADTLSVFFIFLIGWRLLSVRAGLLAALLYAGAVLPIQLSHFWTVDIMSHLFFIVGLYMAVEASRGGWWAYPLFGLMTGCAVASRINLAPMAVMLPIAAFIYLEKYRQPTKNEFVWSISYFLWIGLAFCAVSAGIIMLDINAGIMLFDFGASFGEAQQWTRTLSLTAIPILLIISLVWHYFYLSRIGEIQQRNWLVRGWVVGLLLALSLFGSAVIFRICQPYAFSGPHLTDFDLNPKWFKDIQEVSHYSRFPNEGWPPSTQWYGRLDYIFPWWNMAAWGMGITLGMVATAALGMAIYRQIKVRQLSPILGLLTTWVIVYFALQGGLHQMTMRYYLPLYGVMCLLAAWGIQSLPYKRQWAALIVVGATLLWAFAFHNIYRQPLTRLEASEWLVDNLPGTITLQNESGEMLPVTLDGGQFRYRLQPAFNGESYLGEPFTIDENLSLRGFEARFSDAIPTTIALQIQKEDETGATLVLSTLVFETDAEGVGRLPADQVPVLEPGIYRWWILNRWEGEPLIRHFMPISLWEQVSDGQSRQMAVSFLSPYEATRYHYFPDDQPINFNIKRPFTGTEILIPHMIGSADDLLFTIREQEIHATLIEAIPDSLGETRRYALDQPLEAIPGTVMQITSPEPIYLTGSVIATDGGWEDSLPWGYCVYREKDRPWYQPFPFRDQCEDWNGYASGFYTELGLDMARWDDHAKQLRMIDILFKADYLVLSSNRFYDALPRVPERFAMSAEYFNRLFAGQLGYTLEREFATFPGFLGLKLRDQVLPTADLPEWVNEFEAEEAFTVYDHPTVFVFRNDGFRRENFPDVAPATVGTDDRNRINLAELPEATFQANTAPLTDSQINKLLITWVLGFLALGWLAYPLMFRLFGSLPLHGFSIGRGLAWLLLALIPWWITAAVGLPFWTRSALWIGVGIFALINAYLGYQQRREMRIYLRHRWKVLLAAEMVFLAALAFGLLLRVVDPDLWHTARGGEKPMDFAYLNATLRTPVFPPPNPWFAGFEINYYYFGFVIAALPIKLGNFAPEVAYNLVMGTLYAVVFMNVFTLAYSLLPQTALARWRLALAFIGVLFVMVMGNFGTLKLMFDPEPNMGADRWYWYPSRVLAESANRAGGAFNEMPLFSFLYGDMHAHTIALLPVTLYLLTLLLLINLKKRWLGAVLGMLAAVIYMTNTWDVILYVPLGALGMWLATRSWGRFIPLAVIVGLAGVITVAPFYLNFTLGENGGVQRWHEARSLFEPFLLMWAIPVGVAGVWLLYRLKRVLVPRSDAPVELGILILAALPLLWLSSENATSALCLLYILVGLLLIRYDRAEYRGVHFGVVLIFAVLLFPELYVIKNDVGRMNTVFKTSYQVWLWAGLLIPLALYYLFRNRLYIQAGACLILIALGMFFPINAIPARYDDNQTGEYTLDGSRFMDELVIFNLSRRVETRRDADLIRWLRGNVEGYPVIAEWYQTEYWWHSRIAVQTGLPSLMGWANHMRQQYTHQLPEVEQRLRDIQLLYTTEDINEVRRLIRQYEIEYIIVGELERSAALPATLDIFYTMRDNGELTIVYDQPFTEVYRVEELLEE